MKFEDFVRIMTDISNTGTGNLINRFHNNFPKAMDWYKLKHSVNSVLGPSYRLNIEKFYNQEMFEQYRKFLYISCLYWIDNGARSFCINKAKNVFEAKGIPFIGDKVRVNLHLLLKETFPDDYDADDGAISQNAVLDAEEIMATSSIPERIIYPENTLFYNEFERIWIDGTAFYVPYKEVYGILKDVVFYENQNIYIKYMHCDNFYKGIFTCDNCEQKNKIKQYLVEKFEVCKEEEFQKKMKEKRKILHSVYPSKIRITRFQRVEINADQDIYELNLEFGCSDYVEYLIYQDILRENEIIRKDFEKIIQNFPECIQFNDNSPVWSIVNIGIWIITNDNYLIVSYNNSISGRISKQISYSYFSLEGLDRKIKYKHKYEDGTLVQNMKREISRKWNTDENLYVEEPKMISFGVDLQEGPWMQFSFLARCGLTREEILEKNIEAVHDGEFKIFFIPFTRNAVKAFLRKAEIEPGAGYSLYKIYKSEFNKKYYKQYIR